MLQRNLGVLAVILLAASGAALAKSPQVSKSREVSQPALGAGISIAAVHTASVSRLGGNLGALKYPQGIAVGADGTRYIADSANGRIVAVSASGRAMGSWQVSEPSDNQFEALSDMAIDREGNIYVADGRNNVIVKLSRDGKKLGTIGDGVLKGPLGMGFAPDGRLFVADTMHHQVAVFSADGKLMARWGKEGIQPGELRFPHDVAIGPDSNAYVSDFLNGRISVFTQDGRFVRVIGSPGTGVGQFGNPYAVAFDKAGRLWVSDSENARLQVIPVSAKGGRARVLLGAGMKNGRGFDHPKGFAVTGSGVVVANTGLQSVDSFSVTNGD